MGAPSREQKYPCTSAEPAPATKTPKSWLRERLPTDEMLFKDSRTTIANKDPVTIPHWRPRFDGVSAVPKSPIGTSVSSL